MSRNSKAGKKLLIALCSLVICLPIAFISLKILKNANTRDWLLKEYRYQSPVAEDGDSEQIEKPTDVFVVLADHWEPGYGESNQKAAFEWLESFKQISERHTDSFGRNFQYTWFYPIDNFDPIIMDRLVDTAGAGFGEIEVHWHHNHDGKGDQAFTTDLRAGLERFLSAGALSRDEEGNPRFAFIHGNWALDNSGIPRHCGINNEISILQANGAVADLTFPASGVTFQPAIRQGVYFTTDTPAPRSFDDGRPARIGKSDDGFLMLQGPLALDFKDPLILIEYGALDNARGSGFSGKILRPKTASQYFSDHRVDTWVEHGARVSGKEEWVFVKLHAHGMEHHQLFMNGLLDAALSSLEEYTRRNNIRLHYISAREAINLIYAAIDEVNQPSSSLYDYKLMKPPYKQELH